MRAWLRGMNYTYPRDLGDISLMSYVLSSDYAKLSAVDDWFCVFKCHYMFFMTV